LPRRAAPNREDAFHLAIEQAFSHGTLPDHTRSPKENDLHVD